MLALADGKAVHVLVPNTEILLTRVQLPKTRLAHLARAVPYALEDDLAEDVETLHFAFAVEPQGIAVGVVARSTLEAWLQRLRSLGVEPRALVPEVLAIPWLADTWSILIDDKLALVRTGERSGFGVELSALPTCLSAALVEAKAHPPTEVRVYRGTEIEVEQLLANGLSATSPAVVYQTIERDALAQVLASQPLALDLNLLQGAYAPRARVKNRWVSWRLSAALGVLIVAVSATNAINERARLRAATEDFSTRMASLFRDTFPEIGRTVDPLVQMEQQLTTLRTRQSGARGDFLALLLESGAPLARLDGLRLERLDYQDRRLELELIVPDVQALDELQRSLRSQPRLSLEVLSAAAADEAVRTRIRIERSSS
ncbi:MAG: type II secretion system protein GspL [Gammaproteobacteria bacterium]